jgi:hydrogenase nickel incorporation protein HypA/HybF
MHEIGLLQRMVEVALDRAALGGAERIERMTVRIGVESGVEPEVIAFAFDIATRGTIAEGAELDIEEVRPVCFCAACGLEFEPQDALHECPRCHRTGAEIRRGREFQLASLDVS